MNAKLGKAFTAIPTTFRFKFVNDPPVQDCIEDYIKLYQKAYLSTEH